MKTLIINDAHLGVRRQGGTTPASRADLEKWMMSRFARLVLAGEYDRLIIAGDLFDQRNVPEHHMAEVISVLRGKNCVLMLGNHDLGGIGDSRTMSSAEFVGLMADCQVVKKPTDVLDSLYIIPHLFCQEEFDKAITECPSNIILITHCNVDSPWASGDHSLNLSMAQIQDLSNREIQVLNAHEHQARQVGDNVTVIGNNFPSSIADCLGNKEKHALMITDGIVTEVPTWSAAEDYAEVHHSEPFPEGKKFIRVTGTCSIPEFMELSRKVAKFRSTSDAFIIKNDIKVEKPEETMVSREEITHFNILQLLLSEIKEEYREEVRQCI